jgi:hypothetical protein
MNNTLLDPPRAEPPVQHEVPIPVDASVAADTSTRSGEGASSGAAKQEGKRWPLGAHVTIGAVALFLLAMLAIVTLFSVPSASLFTFDGAIALGILVLSLALSVLLAVANRRQSA